MWFDKYQPKSLEELSLEKSTREFLQSCIDKQDFPNLLLVGNPGSGKTTVSRILLNSISSTSLELNGSSKDRGIETMKTRVADFATSFSKNLNVVFIDEADGLTPEAQDALKGTIDKSIKSCRFIFTGNSIHKFTDAIKSRCISLSFEQFSKRNVILLCKNILDKEAINYDLKDIKTIVDKTYPDIRSCINLLEYASFSGAVILDDSVELFENEYPKLMEYFRQGNVEEIFRIAEKINNFEVYYRQLLRDFLKIDPKFGLTVADFYGMSCSAIDKVIPFVGMFVQLMEENRIKPRMRR